MADKVRFNYYQTEGDFIADKESLATGDITFREDSRKLSTHGHDYKCVSWTRLKSDSEKRSRDAWWSE